jgi:hypothetical protein
MTSDEMIYFKYKRDALNDFVELCEIIEKAGIFDLSNRDDFISKVWSISAYTPRKIDDCIIDLDFNNIIATLTFRETEKTPQISKYVEFFPKETSDYYGFDF